jgi:hypothetical protein
MKTLSIDLYETVDKLCHLQLEDKLHARVKNQCYEYEEAIEETTYIQYYWGTDVWSQLR